MFLYFPRVIWKFILSSILFQVTHDFSNLVIAKFTKFLHYITPFLSEPEAVANVNVFPFREEVLRITWQAPPRQNNPCGIDTYKLLYKLKRHKACSVDEVNQNHKTVYSESPVEYLRGLENYTDYEVSVYAVIMDGSSSLQGPNTTITANTPPNGNIV